MKPSVREMPLKGSFSGLKREQRDSGTGFRSGVLLNQFKAGWRVLWHCIIAGGANLDGFLSDICYANSDVKIF